MSGPAPPGRPVVAGLHALAAEASAPAQTVAELRRRQQSLEELEAGGKQAPPDELAPALQALAALLLQVCSEPQGPTESLAHASYYAALLKALNALLLEARQQHGLHAATLVKCLRRFWRYGASGAGAPAASEGPALWRSASRGEQPQAREAATPRSGSYQPPQRRAQQPRAGGGARASDSEASDSEGGLGSGDRLRSSRARLAALLCLQTLARLDARALLPLWPALLPAFPAAAAARGGEESLLDVIARDPAPKATWQRLSPRRAGQARSQAQAPPCKERGGGGIGARRSQVRAAAASAVAALLDGPQQRAYMAIAEHRGLERAPVRGFTTISASLGHLALAAHAGLLAAAAAEQSPAVQAAVLRALAALVAATPYARLPPQLLVDAVQALRKLLERAGQPAGGGASSRGGAGSVQSAALACLAAAAAARPPHAGLGAHLGRGGAGAGLVPELLQWSQPGHAAAAADSLAVLQGVAGGYPAAVAPHAGWLLSLAASLAQRATSGRQQQEQEELAAVQAVRAVAALLSGLPEPPAAAPEQADGSGARGGRQPGADGQPGDAAQLAHGLADCSLGFEPAARACGELFQQAAGHASAALRAAAHSLPAACQERAFARCPAAVRAEVLRRVAAAATGDAAPHVRAAAGKAAAQLSGFPSLASAPDPRRVLARTAQGLLADQAVSVRAQGGAALASLAASLRACGPGCLPALEGSDGGLTRLTEAALAAASDAEKVAVSALRALGILLALGFAAQPCPDAGLMHQAVLCYRKALQAGSAKAQWNACYGIGGLLQLPAAADALEATLQLPELLLAVSAVAASSPNFKSRKHAAGVLAAVGSRRQCGAHFARIQANLRAAVDEAANPAFSGAAAEPAPAPPLDFRSLPEMRQQLQAALARFTELGVQ